MSRPDKLPSWCDDDAASKVVEPSGTKKLQGWIYKERPAFQFWNWIFRNFVKWILHLDASVNQFDPHEAATPDMTVIISAGKVQNGTTLTSIAEQTTAAFVAPSGNPRIDRIVVDNVTGVYSVIAGTEAASPVAPDLAVGKIAVCQILLDNSPATTEITNDLITDERGLVSDLRLVVLDTPELLDTINTAGIGVWYDEVSDSWSNNTLTNAGAKKAIIKCTAAISSGSWTAYCRKNGLSISGTVTEFARSSGFGSGETIVNLDDDSLFEWRVDGTYTADSVSLVLVGYYL